MAALPPPASSDLRIDAMTLSFYRWSSCGCQLLSASHLHAGLDVDAPTIRTHGVICQRFTPRGRRYTPRPPRIIRWLLVPARLAP